MLNKNVYFSTVIQVGELYWDFSLKTSEGNCSSSACNSGSSSDESASHYSCELNKTSQHKKSKFTATQRNHITNESMTHTWASFSRWKLESKLEKFKRKLLWYWGTRKVSTTVLKSQVHVRVIDLYCWTVAVIACSTGSLSMLDAP